MTKNELEIPKDGSISVWPHEDHIDIAVFNKRGQRRFTLRVSPADADRISDELKKTASFVRKELLKNNHTEDSLVYNRLSKDG
jgi:hypothetical protein